LHTLIPTTPHSKPHIVSRDEHNISRDDISENALKVLNRLNEAGFQACLVGGSVRDLLLGHKPKDFDVATDADPDQVRALFRNCRLIGRRFRLAHIYFGREIIEVATFRGAGSDIAEHGKQQLSDNGRILRDNVYGTIEEDVWRRDITVNALFYNIRHFEVLDYVGGVEDIKAGVIRIIGDPKSRYHEDPVRMLRVVRFAAKFGFKLHPDTETHLKELSYLLDDMPTARLFDETIKLFLNDFCLASFKQLKKYDLFGYLLLQTEDALSGQLSEHAQKMVQQGLENTANRVTEGKPVTPAFLFAFMLWVPLVESMQEQGADMRDIMALNVAAGDVFSAQAQQTSIPRRFSYAARDIWALQARFYKRRGKQPQRFLGHPRLRAAYDFLLLRNQAGEELDELCNWWTDYQSLEENRPHLHVRHVNRDEQRRPHRRHRPGKGQI